MYDALSRVNPSKICCGVPASSPLHADFPVLVHRLYDKWGAKKSTACSSAWTLARRRSRRRCSTRTSTWSRTAARRRPGAAASSTPTRCCQRRIAAAEQALDGRRVHAIGVASMAETGVLTDDALRPVVPSIAWWDERGERGGGRARGRVAGLLRAHRPAADLDVHARQVRAGCAATGRTPKRGTRWFNVAEWIVLGLGGDPRPEASLASRTGFYDLHTGRRVGAGAWRWADAPATPRPRPHVVSPAHEVPATRRTLDGARLAVGGHDHAAAAVGAGRGGRGRRARLVRHRRGDPARDRAAGPRRPSAGRSPTGSRSAATPSRTATSCRARSGPARSFKLSSTVTETSRGSTATRSRRSARPARTSSPAWRRSPARTGAW